MSQLFEYGILTYYNTISHKSSKFDLSAKGAQGVVTRELNKVMDILPTLMEKHNGGNWDMNSHSIAIHGDTFMVTFLLQRMKV